MINKAGQALKVFSDSDIKLIQKALAKLQNVPNTGSFHAYTNGFDKQDFIYPLIKKLVLDKLQLLINKQLNLTVGMILKEKNPWYIHTDYVKNDQSPEYAFLIPLQPANTYTVIFNEESLTSFNNYIKINKKIENNAKNLYNNLCSHETIDRLEYVSLFAAYKWELGSVIYWDRKLLHCSDNFLQNGLQEKTALVLFTNNDK